MQSISVGNWTDGVEFLAQGYLHDGYDQILLFLSFPAGSTLLVQPFSHVFISRPLLPQLNEIWKKKKKTLCLRTLQVQVFGSCGCLCSDLGVNLDSVEVVGVSGNYDIVPVVVVEGLVWVAFDQVGSISQVGNIVQVTATR